MRISYIVPILLLAAICAYIIAYMTAPFPFFAFLIVTLLPLAIAVLWLISIIIWKLLPAKLRANFRVNKLRYGTFLAICALLFISSTFASHEFTAQPVIFSTEKLKSLPYLPFVIESKHEGEVGVTVYKPHLASKGFNIYNSTHKPGAYLVNMKGEVVHSWMPVNTHPRWHYVKMCANGDLLVVIKDVMLMRLDWNSNIIWTKKMRAHHDVDVDEDGNIYVLTRRDDVIFKRGLPVPVLGDYIVVLSPGGKVKKEVSLYNVLDNDIPDTMVGIIYNWLSSPGKRQGTIKNFRREGYFFMHGSALDLFHTNTLEIIDKDFNNAFKKGHILLCSYMLDLVWVIDLENERILWGWGQGYLESPHHPALLENGNILVFDNGNRRRYSRVVEFNPASREVVWNFTAEPPSSFFDFWGGANQRLPNGNTLITDSVKGRVFELTKDFQIAWEFYNPDKDAEGRRATIYRMMRITDVENYPILKEVQHDEGH